MVLHASFLSFSFFCFNFSFICLAWLELIG